MQMPQPTEEHQKLQALAGEWTGEDMLHPSPWDPKGGPATTGISARMDLDGFFLVMDCEQRRDGKVGYRGHGVFGYDPQKQRYTMHWFDNMACNPGGPALGTWQGNRLCFQSQHEMGHGRFTYEFTGDGAYTFRLEHSQDGQDWALFLEGKYRRTSS